MCVHIHKHIIHLRVCFVCESVCVCVYVRYMLNTLRMRRQITGAELARTNANLRLNNSPVVRADNFTISLRDKTHASAHVSRVSECVRHHRHNHHHHRHRNTTATTRNEDKTVSAGASAASSLENLLILQVRARID